MFDMDNFKAVNELLGYDIGDRFIQVIGHEIKKAADEYGKDSYRFGGEEFYILMPETDPAEAVEIATKAKDALFHNKELEQYMWRAIFEGKLKIKKLEEKQAPYMEFQESLARYNTFKKAAAGLFDDEFEIDPKNDIRKKLQACAIENDVREKFQALMIEAYKRAATVSDKEFIASKAEKMYKTQDVNHFCDESLNSYLYTNFNNEAKIAQIKRWITELQKPDCDSIQQGFTITCGLKQFDDMDLSAKEIIKQIGDVLALGKTEDKGKVYLS